MKGNKTTENDKSCFFKKNKKLVIIISAILILTVAAAVILVILGNRPDSGDDHPSYNPITDGRDEVVYYYRVPNGEMLLTLKAEWRFTLVGPDTSKSGGYRLNGDDEITLDFVRDEDGTASAKLGQNKLTLVIGENDTYTYREKISFTVSFETDGGTIFVPASVVNGKTVTEPDTPVKEGYTFGGWYKDKALTTPFDFATVLITEDTAIYAKWIPNDPA